MNKPTHKSVVIVDDEQTYTSLLTQLLSDYFDCRVVTFSRPLEALAALPELDPGVVVTDYRMPQMNGVEFIGRAAVMLPDVPFILITGHTEGMLDRAELAKVNGLKSLLLKPFGWHQLGSEIIRLWPEPGVTLLRRELHPASA